MQEKFKTLTYGLVVLAAFSGGVAIYYANRPKQIGPDMESIIELLEGVNERYIAIGGTAPYTNLPISPNRMSQNLYELPCHIETLARTYCYYTNGEWVPLININNVTALFAVAGIGPGDGVPGWNIAFTPTGNVWYDTQTMQEEIFFRYGLSPWTGFLWECYRALSVMTTIVATLEVAHGGWRQKYDYAEKPFARAYHSEVSSTGCPAWYCDLNILPSFSNILCVYPTDIPQRAVWAPPTNRYWGERIEIQGVRRASRSLEQIGENTYWYAAEALGTNWFWDRQVASGLLYVASVTGIQASIEARVLSELSLYLWRWPSNITFSASAILTNNIDFITEPTNIFPLATGITNSWDLFDWRATGAVGIWAWNESSFWNGHAITGRLDHTLMPRSVIRFKFRRCRPPDSQP